jgi:hypothetical protein
MKRIKVDRVNFFRTGGRWSYSAWGKSGFVHCGALEAETPEEAWGKIEALFPGAAILRLGDEEEER